MAHIQIEITGIPVDDAQFEALHVQLQETVRALAGTTFRPPITVLLGHQPMVIAEGLDDNQQHEIAEAVVNAVLMQTNTPIDPVNQGQVQIYFVPENEYEDLLRQAVELIAMRDERIYALERASSDPDTAEAIQQEVEDIERQLMEIRDRFNPGE